MEKIRITWFYIRKIYCQSIIEVWEGIGIVGRLIDGLLLVGAIVGGVRGKVEELDTWIVLFVVALVLIPIIAIFNTFKVAALRDKEQQRKLELNEYEDIEIVKYNYPWTAREQQYGVSGLENAYKLAIKIINNGGVQIRDSIIKPIHLECNTLRNDSGWAPSFNQLPIKPFIKLDNISSNGGVEIALLAEADSQLGGFKFNLLDNNLSTKHVMAGFYRLEIQLEGQAEKEDKVVDLHPIRFLVSFKYVERRFTEVSVSILPRRHESKE